MSRYCWRLHPTSAGRLPCSGPDQSVGKGIAVCNTKFRLNDNVYIRPKSVRELGITGRIVDFSFNSTAKSNSTSEITTESSSQRGKKRRLIEDVRVSVQQHCFDTTTNRIKCSGATKLGIRPSRLFPVYDIDTCKDKNSITQTLLIMTSDTTNYRQLATSHLRPSDKVLEVGCSTGECTALMMRRLHQQRQKQIQEGAGEDDNSTIIMSHGRIVAFDVGADILEQAQARLLSEIRGLSPHDGEDKKHKICSQLVTLQKIDAVADPKGAYDIAMADRKPDIILIDIGGNRELKGVVRMLHWVQTAFEKDPPRLVIVKSESLVEEYSRFWSKPEEVKKSANQPNVVGNGVIEHAQHWFLSLVSSFEETSEKGTRPTQKVPKYSHPVQAPLSLSPKDNATPICRFHNYHPDGCKRLNDSRKCPYDHEHCHWCKQTGHVALNCKH
jgi:hypothetical protein